MDTQSWWRRNKWAALGTSVYLVSMTFWIIALQIGNGYPQGSWQLFVCSVFGTVGAFGAGMILTAAVKRETRSLRPLIAAVIWTGIVLAAAIILIAIFSPDSLAHGGLLLAVGLILTLVGALCSKAFPQIFGD